MSIENFGDHLLSSGDLDPIYIALNRAVTDPAQKARWLIGYWCFYSAATASFLSEAEGHEFWRWVQVAAENKEPSPADGRWPRGHERRHFRGANAEKSVADLRARYGPRPEEMVERIVQPWVEIRGGEQCVEPLDVKKVSARAQEHVGFGPWIGFKIADMVDRCLGVPVLFDNAHVFMFKDPEEAALKLWRLKLNLPDSAKPKDRAVVLEGVTLHLQRHFRDHLAPPYNDRPPNIQEIETILCKWKSHMNGHYPLNNDIDEINAGLDDWMPFCPTARRFREAMPQPLLENAA